MMTMTTMTTMTVLVVVQNGGGDVRSRFKEGSVAHVVSTHVPFSAVHPPPFSSSSSTTAATASSPIAEGPIHRRSISSIDDTATYNEGGGAGGAVARLANKFGSLRDNITSLHDTIWTAHTDYAYDTRLLFKRKITNLYVSLSSLKSYVEVNHSGFRKILKKYAIFLVTRIVTSP